MPDISKHHRRSIRLKNYDYSQFGYYYITICAQNHQCLFGDVKDHKLILNNAGKMVFNALKTIPMHYAGIDIDEFIIMPNHIHMIIIINNVGANPRVRSDKTKTGQGAEGQTRDLPLRIN